MPSAIAISSYGSTKLPVSDVLKVFLATRTKQKSNNRILDWIDEWNCSDAKQFGSLHLVSDIMQADVIVAREVC